jgi:hypothetical protein
VGDELLDATGNVVGRVTEPVTGTVGGLLP